MNVGSDITEKSGLDGLAHIDPTWAPHGLAIWDIDKIY